MAERQRVAIFDYKINSVNPIGSCHLALLRALCHEYDFTVFAVEFENPAPDRIRWVRVPAITRPLALLFITFHVMAPLCYLAWRVRGRPRFHLVQSVESNLTFADVVYAHFSHRTFLRRYWTQASGHRLRVWLRWLDHALHAWLEPRTYRRARHVVVPSPGLRRELIAEHPPVAETAHVIPNPVAVERLRPPESFDAARVRAELGLGPEDVVLLFVALGHFERKGLPELLEGMAGAADSRVALVVVGGERDLVEEYERRAAALGVGSRTRFAGMRRDIAPYLWMADAFILPSAYETFSLVVVEAAAAGLPVIVPPLSGIEFLRDGENAILITRTPAGVRAGIERLLGLSAAERRRLGARAQRDVQAFNAANFATAWRAFYAGVLDPGAARTSRTSGGRDAAPSRVDSQEVSA